MRASESGHAPIREVAAVPTGMSVVEREHYVRWWIEESGLTPFQLGQLSTAIWSDGATSGRESDVGSRSRSPYGAARGRPSHVG